MPLTDLTVCFLRSPSPRRAWIEIVLIGLGAPCRAVALPTEGVD